MVIRDGNKISFYATAEEFVALACGVGLCPVRHWRHDYPDTRNNFLRKLKCRMRLAPAIGTGCLLDVRDSSKPNPKHSHARRLGVAGL